MYIDFDIVYIGYLIYFVDIVHLINFFVIEVEIDIVIVEFYVVIVDLLIVEFYGLTSLPSDIQICINYKNLRLIRISVITKHVLENSVELLGA